MAIIKKNIWALFYIILFLGTFILSILIYEIYNDTYDKHLLAQENITKINAYSVESSLNQFELILDILSEQLQMGNTYLDSLKTRAIFDEVLKSSKYITAFELAKPNGQLYATSSNLKNIKKLPNLLEKKETKSSFAHTLESSSMVLGRTYYHNTLNALVIPIRKTIKDTNGNIIAVITAGINTTNVFNFVSNTNNLTTLFRDYDYYRQLTSKGFNKKVIDYTKPLPKKFIDNIKSNFELKYQKSIEQLSGQVLTNVESSFKVKQNTLLSALYIKRYELWITSPSNVDDILKEIYKKSSILIILFLIAYFTIYFLFRVINAADKKREQALLYQAHHDYLTSLYNRLYLSKYYDNLQNHSPFILYFIDMDNFKRINDNYGHTYGDKILQEVSKRLQAFRKENDVVVRYSGDEFMLISHNVNKTLIKKTATDILNSLSMPYIIDQYQFMLGASIGISQYPLNAKSFDELKIFADLAMYTAKKNKNDYCIFEHNLRATYEKTSLLENELKLSLKRNEISMVYQPQVDINGDLYGVEALVRWQNKTLGSVSPEEFIQIAESIGYMGELGDFILNTSLNEIHNLQTKLNKQFQLSINISVKQFMQIEFYDSLFTAIQSHEFSNCNLTLEVTENLFIEDLEFILNLLNKLKQKNIKISLDDFGTGYSSLSLLRALPIDELKIDKSFVDDITNNNDSLNLIESIITIGKNLHMSILAEGVETIEQKEQLANDGCDLFQGYLFSKPLSIEKLEDYLKS